MAEWLVSDGGEDNMVSLGCGSFVAPLPQGWKFEPGLPLTGHLIWPRGERLAWSIECYEDAEAAAGGDRLVELAADVKYGDVEKSSVELLDEILVRMPAGGSSDDGPIALDWFEPFAGTHIRQLRIELPPHPDVELRASQITAVIEWLHYGNWSQDRTRLDDLAQTATLRRESFGPSLLMRVPRDWKITALEENRGAYGQRWAAEPEDELETLWLNSFSVRMDIDSPEAMEEFAAGIVSGANEKRGDEDHLLREHYERLGEYDLLSVRSSTEEDEEGPLRRTTYVRMALGEGYLTTATIHLCTDLAHVDEPRFLESALIVEEEVKNALIVPLRP